MFLLVRDRACLRLPWRGADRSGRRQILQCRCERVIRRLNHAGFAAGNPPCAVISNQQPRCQGLASPEDAEDVFCLYAKPQPRSQILDRVDRRVAVPTQPGLQHPVVGGAQPAPMVRWRVFACRV
jgi:hypothetical protein